MTLAGYETLHDARDMEMVLSSSGCLKTSKTSLGNSGNSSKNSIPLCARVTSPGKRSLPPQTIETLLAVWWTCLSGLCTMSGWCLSSMPLSE